MINQSRKWLILLTLTVALCITAGCLPFDDGNSYESAKSDGIRSYNIDSATILDALRTGKTDVFTPQEATSQSPASPSAKPISWSQANYLLVAQVLEQKLWQTPPVEQKLYNMNFSMNCSEIDQGNFSEAEFASFEIIQAEGKEIRIEYHIRIIPTKNIVQALKTEYSPNIKTKEPIDLKRYQFSAEAALQIAEVNGGAKKREEYINDCQITAFTPEPKSKGWRVFYQNSHDGLLWTIFEIVIDPETGSYKVKE